VLARRQGRQALFRGAMGRVDHNSRRLSGLEGAIVDFRPQRSACARWACLHTAFVLAAVGTPPRDARQRWVDHVEHISREDGADKALSNVMTMAQKA
jgi:hypothetical protein